MNEKKKPTLDELLEELNHPRVDVDWKSGVQPELLAEVDPDEIGWDWDVTDEDGSRRLNALLAQCDPDAPLQDVDWGPDVGLEDSGSGDVPDEK
ncbi:hypothetical protein D3C86_1235130 [compost metagenome]